MTFQLVDNRAQGAVIKVIGVGGGGGNAVEHMIGADIGGVEFICANTDAQALDFSSSRIPLQIGINITKGLGAGSDPEVGRQAAMEDRDRISEALEGADMVFITAGMGGGTGTGAAPIIAQVAKDMGILTVAVVTSPFPMEGKKRMSIATSGLDDLKQFVDSLITVSNERLLDLLGDDIDMLDAFSEANNILLGAVQGIAELITNPGVINVDFADVRTVMAEMGMAMIGSGSSAGEDRAAIAAEKAVASPLLEGVNLKGARGILVNVTSSKITMGEFKKVGAIIGEFATEDATIVMGTAIDPAMEDDLRVTVVATGLGRKNLDDLSAEPFTPSIVTPATGRPDYSSLDKPTIIRKGGNTSGDPTPSMTASRQESDEFDVLNIPAFLRRQLD